MANYFIDYDYDDSKGNIRWAKRGSEGFLQFEAITKTAGMDNTLTLWDHDQPVGFLEKEKSQIVVTHSENNPEKEIQVKVNVSKSKMREIYEEAQHIRRTR